MVERSLSMREVPGSIPGASTLRFAQSKSDYKDALILNKPFTFSLHAQHQNQSEKVFLFGRLCFFYGSQVWGSFKIQNRNKRRGEGDFFKKASFLFYHYK